MTLLKESFENIVGKEENVGIQLFVLLQYKCYVKTLYKTTLSFINTGEGFSKHCIFSISLNDFYSAKINFQFLSCIYCVLCKFFQYGLVQNVVVRLRVKSSSVCTVYIAIATTQH